MCAQMPAPPRAVPHTKAAFPHKGVSCIGEHLNYEFAENTWTTITKGDYNLTPKVEPLSKVDQIYALRAQKEFDRLQDQARQELQRRERVEAPAAIPAPAASACSTAQRNRVTASAAGNAAAAVQPDLSSGTRVAKPRKTRVPDKRLTRKSAPWQFGVQGPGDGMSSQSAAYTDPRLRAL
jgi:hypothetical protein